MYGTIVGIVGKNPGEYTIRPWSMVLNWSALKKQYINPTQVQTQATARQNV